MTLLSVTKPKILWPLLLALAALPLVAQKRTPPKQAATTFKLISLKVEGTSRYTDKEILAASGLHIGQTVAEADFKEAAQRVVDSGVFSDVSYSFSYTDAGAKLDMQLTDIEPSKLVPARFENFVWFTDAELLAVLQQRVPMYKELVPVAGRLAEQIKQSLQDLLSESKYPGRVESMHEGTMEGDHIVGVVFQVMDVSIQIRDVEFPGATPELAALLAKPAQKLDGVDYLRSRVAIVAKFDFLPVFQQRGFLKAAFGSPTARVLPHSASDTTESAANDIQVTAIVPVTPGKQYLVSDVTWKGNSALTMLEAAPLFHLTPGKPADAVRVDSDAETLLKLYRSRGYMAAKFKPEAQFNDDKATVHYDLTVEEGDQYRMGELEILGLDSASTARVQEAWKLPEGQPYNADYTHKFLNEVPRLLPPGARYSTKINEQTDAKTKTVDLTIQFKMQ